MSVKSNAKMTIAGFLALLVGVSLALSGGAAAVDYDGNYSADDSVHVSEMFDVTDSTATVWADIETIDDIAPSDDTDNSTDLRFVVQGVNESAASNSTELVNETRTVQQGTLESFSYETTDADNAEYNSYYVHVESVTDGESDRINSTDSGVTVYSSGGGGILPGGSGGMSVPIIGGIVVVGYLYARD